jgi:uncharacterized membrane protein
MEKWMIYGMIAAMFIAIRDIFSNDLINRYDYTEYVIYANIIVFIFTIIYILTFNVPLKKPNYNDLFVIIIRLFIVYLIIEPCIFYSIKYCKNPGYAKSIINLNTLFVFILAILFFNAEINMKRMFGILMILSGPYFLS